MIRLVTSRRLAGLEHERTRLRKQVEEAAREAEAALDREFTAVRQANHRQQQAEQQRSAALFAHEVTQSVIANLREENGELVAEVRAAEQAAKDADAEAEALNIRGQAASLPRWAYVLMRRDEPVSAHASHDAAGAEAVRRGATGSWKLAETSPATANWSIYPTPFHHEDRQEGGGPS